MVQYVQLGTKGFAARYVKGFIQGGCYEGIPLEKNAYELESRFHQNQADVFSVFDEVRQRLEEGELEEST